MLKGLAWCESNAHLQFVEQPVKMRPADDYGIEARSSHMKFLWETRGNDRQVRPWVRLGQAWTVRSALKKWNPNHAMNSLESNESATFHSDKLIRDIRQKLKIRTLRSCVSVADLVSEDACSLTRPTINACYSGAMLVNVSQLSIRRNYDKNGHVKMAFCTWAEIWN